MGNAGEQKAFLSTFVAASEQEWESESLLTCALTFRERREFKQATSLEINPTE